MSVVIFQRISRKNKMKIKVAYFTISLLTMTQLCVFAQKKSENIIENKIRTAFQNDPKRSLRKQFELIKDVNTYYHFRDVDKLSEIELKKYRGDLWVLKYQYKLSYDPTLLKPILIKSLGINESSYSYDGESISYLLNYLKKMPEDSIFSESFLPILNNWIEDTSINSTSFEYFKNLSLKLPLHQYIRDMYVAQVYKKHWKEPYLSMYCKNGLKEIKEIKLNLDLETRYEFIGFVTNLEEEVLYHAIEKNYFEGDFTTCEDSLLKVYINKSLAFQHEKINEVIASFLRKAMDAAEIKISNQDIDNFIKAGNPKSLLNLMAGRMNNIAFKIYENPKYTSLALELVNKSISIIEIPENFDTKAQILYKQKKYTEAAQNEAKAMEKCDNCEELGKYRESYQKFKMKE